MRSLRSRRAAAQQGADNTLLLWVGFVVVLLIVAVVGYYLYATGKLSNLTDALGSSADGSRNWRVQRVVVRRREQVGRSKRVREQRLRRRRVQRRRSK
ncbi:hypothetical protein JCM10450v2_005739 [Rhodotorula kratochvilovae]